MRLTHYTRGKTGVRFAAALRYRPGQDQAPVVIASGRGTIADNILRLAEEAGIPHHVDPALAAILARLEPGTPIPEETYRLVAEILAFIWRMDGKVSRQRSVVNVESKD